MPQKISQPEDLKPGEIYEDSSYHPCLCLGVDEFEVYGISLIDGSYPRGDDLGMSGVRKLSLEEAEQWKLHGPSDVELKPESRWWKQKP